LGGEITAVSASHFGPSAADVANANRSSRPNNNEADIAAIAANPNASVTGNIKDVSQAGGIRVSLPDYKINSTM